MDKILFCDENIEISISSGSYFIKYDAGSHQSEFRRDEITNNEANLVSSSPKGTAQVLFALQRRLIESGVNPYKSNL